jgi:hypothetical protein
MLFRKSEKKKSNKQNVVDPEKQFNRSLLAINEKTEDLPDDIFQPIGSPKTTQSEQVSIHYMLEDSGRENEMTLCKP